MDELTEEQLDEQISKLKIEVSALLRMRKTAYDAALKFHTDMCTGKRRKSEKNLIIHDRAIVVIRDYRRKNPQEWEMIWI